MRSLILGWFMLGSYDADTIKKPEMLLTPEQKLQAVIKDAHFYKNYQKLETGKIVENLTTQPGTFAPQAITDKFGTTKNAAELISAMLKDLEQESKELPQKLIQAKKEENITANSSRDSLENFKHYSITAKNHADLYTAIGGITCIMTLAYWLKNLKNEVKGPLLSLVFSSGGFSLLNFLARTRHAQHEKIIQRTEDIGFEQEILTRLNGTLKN